MLVCWILVFTAYVYLILPGRMDLNGCFESRIGLRDISLGGHDLVRERLAWLLSSGLA